jgi:WD40 repeat protein
MTAQRCFVFLGLLCFATAQSSSLPSRGQDSGQAQLIFHQPISKSISREALGKFTRISVNVSEQGKNVNYSGAPLRDLLKEQIAAIDSMSDWKKLAKQKIILEVLGKDGFPALISAVEVATNQSGDRFILATESDGKPTEGVRLICPNDEHHVRWVRDCVTLRLVSVDQ